MNWLIRLQNNFHLSTYNFFYISFYKHTNLTSYTIFNLYLYNIDKTVSMYVHIYFYLYW